MIFSLYFFDWFFSKAIWFLPKDNAYGPWPASGEIDLVLSRGNKNYTNLEKHIGVEQFASSLHFGPFADLDLYQTALFMRNAKPGNGFNNDFHRFQMEWTPGKCTLFWNLKFDIEKLALE